MKFKTPSVLMGGYEFQVSPALKATGDGVALPISSFTSSNNGMGPLPGGSSPTGSWNASLNTDMSSNGVPVSNSFEAKSAAIFGGSEEFLSIRLASVETVGAIEAQTLISDHGAQFRTQAIAAPVPEPETYAMLLAGLRWIGAVGRRRNKR